MVIIFYLIDIICRDLRSVPFLWMLCLVVMEWALFLLKMEISNLINGFRLNRIHTFLV
jgi:hypothetical protein